MPDPVKPLRIVHAFRSPVGGIFKHVRDLAAAQEAAGHKVAIVCDSSTGGDFEARMFAALEPKLSLGVHRTPMQRHIGLGDIAAAWRTFAIIKSLQPDVLHGHGAKGGLYARAFGSVLRVFRSRAARLYSPHGGSLHYDAKSLSGRAFFLAERAMEMATDHILFVADFERKAFAEKIGGPHAPWSVVYNGLSPEEFEPVLPKPGAADFLYIGMMRDLKGPDLFIAAIAALKTGPHKNVTACMVGAGEDLPRYKAEVTRLGLDSAISFFDPIAARQAFALARTVVVPSRAEAMPYIVLETLAAARPLIATRVGGIPEILGADCAALCEPDAASLIAAMDHALADPAWLTNAMPGRQSIEARFSAAAMASSVLGAYQRALAAN